MEGVSLALFLLLFRWSSMSIFVFRSGHTSVHRSIAEKKMTLSPPYRCRRRRPRLR